MYQITNSDLIDSSNTWSFRRRKNAHFWCIQIKVIVVGICKANFWYFNKKQFSQIHRYFFNFRWHSVNAIVACAPWKKGQKNKKVSDKKKSVQKLKQKKFTRENQMNFTNLNASKATKSHGNVNSFLIEIWKFGTEITNRAVSRMLCRWRDCLKLWFDFWVGVCVWWCVMVCVWLHVVYMCELCIYECFGAGECVFKLYQKKKKKINSKVVVWVGAP